VVWGLTGFWHGASWNFVLWGLYYAVLLIIEKLFLLKLLGKLPKFIGHIYAMVAVVLGWALFYFEDITRLGGFLGQLFTPAAVTVQGGNLILGYLPMLLISAVAATPLLHALGAKLEDKAWSKWVKLALLAVVFLLCIAALASDSYNPFIYFRF
jgi:alginate O-acetyltransferase complex protein AlgI